MQVWVIGQQNTVYTLTKSDYVQFNIENNIRQAQHTVQCEHDMYAAMHFI